MNGTAEPIELALVLVAGLAFAGSVALGWRAWQSACYAERNGRHESVRLLGRLRVANEGMRGLLVLAVLLAGLIQATLPSPPVPGPSRPYLQAIWVTIAAGNLLMSIVNEIVIRRVIATIERDAP